MTISPEFCWRRRLIVMLKEPRPGRVKTRLGHEIGMTSAAWWFRHQSNRLLRQIDNPKWETILAVTPDSQSVRSPLWPGHLPRVSQGSGDLGQRMARIFHTMPPGPACIIGADIPGIRPLHIQHAFEALGRYEAVFGPATDGGYWLVGLKRSSPPPPTLFQNVRWSTGYALRDSEASLAGHRIARINQLDDIDTLADLNDFRRKQQSQYSNDVARNTC